MSPLRRESVRSSGCQMRVLRRILLGTATGITLAALTACDTPGVTLVDPDVAGDKDRSLTVTVRLEDSTLAQALGWSQGVPEAQVFLSRIGDEFNPITLVTDSTGTVVLQTFLPGQYRMAAHRVLRENETGPTDGVVRAFGDGGKFWVAPPRVLEFTLQMDQAGSVVISEILTFGRFTPTGPWSEYRSYQYFELHNNSDSTVYLDGMLWGWAWNAALEYTSYPCAVTEPFRNDPLGLWANYIQRFPGSGNDYPLAPGQTVVVALDAVDHSVVHPNLPDLTTADFELEGSADPDNPDVPNLSDVGPDLFFRGHGVEPLEHAPLFLAQPLDLSTLAEMRDPFWGIDWVRIPMESVLDVVKFATWHPLSDQIAPYCPLFVPRFLDRLEARTGSYVGLTLQRGALRVATGLAKLQDLGFPG